MRQASIGSSGVANLEVMLKRGSGRERFPVARPGSERWIDDGGGMTIALVVKAMLRKSANVGFSIVFHNVFEPMSSLWDLCSLSTSTREPRSRVIMS